MSLLAERLSAPSLRVLKSVSILDHSLSVIPVNTVVEMTVRVMSYIDMEIMKEISKAQKESKK